MRLKIDIPNFVVHVFKNNFLKYYACNSAQLLLLHPSLSLQAAPARFKRACKEPFLIKFSKNLIIMTYIMWNALAATSQNFLCKNYGHKELYEEWLNSIVVLSMGKL